MGNGPISRWLLAAALLSVALGVAHSVLGERYILRRLFTRTNLPVLFGSDDFTKRTLRFAWHITTVAWCGVAVTIVALGGGSARDGLMVLGATALLSAAVALVGSRGRHASWIVLAVIGACILLGTRSS